MARNWWLIDIAGYGDFAYFGTQGEAEEMRSHKANWEGGRGTKKRIDKGHPDAVAETARNWSDFDRGIPIQTSDPRLVELRNSNPRQEQKDPSRGP